MVLKELLFYDSCIWTLHILFFLVINSTPAHKCVHGSVVNTQITGYNLN